MAITKVSRGLLSTGVSDSSDATAITIDSSENVGIGTTSPARKVQIQDTSASVYLAVTSANNNAAGIMFGDTDDETMGRVTYDNTNNSMQFWTNDSQKMLIDSSGNLGIGTSSPAGKLQAYTSANRFQSLQGAAADLEIVSDNNSSPVALIKGTGNADLLNVFDNTTEVFTILDGGNVGIGTASPSSKLQIMGGTSGVDQISLSSNLSDNTAKDAGIIMTMYTNNTAALIGGLAINGNTSLVYGSSGTDHRGVTKHIWYTNTNYNSTSGNTERMRIDSSGNLLVGTTSSSYGNVAGIVINNSGANVQALTTNSASSSAHYIGRFYSGSGEIGNIYYNGSATAYNTSSDARLKDVTGEARGLEVINELNPVAYNWKDSGQADEGLIAQEVMEIVPNAVSGSEEDIYQMDYSKLVTPLVKAIQELSAEVEELKTKLENK